MTAPTEAEIRAHIEEHASDYEADFGRVLSNFTSVVEYDPPDLDRIDPEDTSTSLWRDLRPSETARLRDLLHEAVWADLEDRFRRETIDAIVGACLTFAAEHPNAPRAEPELVSAG